MIYIGIRDAVKGTTERGRGTLLTKVDIQSAYCNIPVHPENCWLTGMLWRYSLFMDAALPFGLQFTPKNFTAMVDAAEWII